MLTQTTYAVYWKPVGVVMSDVYTLTINQYLSDVGGTAFFNILTQYTDTVGAAQNQSVFGGSWTDPHAYPHAGTIADPLTDADIQGEITRAINLNPEWQAPGLTTLYLIYTGKNVVSCSTLAGGCSTDSYCSFHASFISGTVHIPYANMPYNRPNAGCGGGLLPPGDSDANVEIDLTAHEQFEAANDPLTAESDPNKPSYPVAWLDPIGGEIGDLCVDVYGSLDGNHTNVALHAHRYKIQAMWSNADNACRLAYMPHLIFLPMTSKAH